MTIPLLTAVSPLLPNVPDLPGVPPVARLALTEAVAALPMLGIDLSGLFGGAVVEKWGLINQAYQFVLEPDSVVSVEIDDGYQVCDFPVEQGEFASYNKVKQPFQGTVVMSKGGSTADRQAFLEALKSIRESLTPYYVLVPEGSYGPATVDRVSVERHAHNGAAFIVARLHISEIRVAPAIAYGSAQSSQPQSSVPASAQTNPTTSTGLPDPAATSSPTSQAIVGGGAVGASTPSGAVQAALNASMPVANW